jgi:hypothetical protein
MSEKIDAATATMIRNIEQQSGKTMADWKKIVLALGPLKHGEIVKTLKERHGLGHGQANLVAHHAKGAVDASGAASADAGDLVETMFAGEKAALRPIYDSIVTAVKAFGGDVEIAPKKANVSLRRSKQFGLLQPSTKARLDVGINLKGEPPAGRLEASGSFSAMVTHRVRVESAADVNKELIGWLRQAYDRA